MALKRAGKGFVLGVSSDHGFNSWGKPRAVSGSAQTTAGGLAASEWTRLSAGEGTKCWRASGSAHKRCRGT